MCAAPSLMLMTRETAMARVLLTGSIAPQITLCCNDVPSLLQPARCGIFPSSLFNHSDCETSNLSALIRARVCNQKWTSTTNSPLIYAACGPLIFSDQRPSADRSQRKSAVNQDTKSHFHHTRALPEFTGPRRAPAA